MLFWRLMVNKWELYSEEVYVQKNDLDGRHTRLMCS